MDDSKFLFVTCVNDEQQYLTCKEYIGRLNVPRGYRVELYPVRNAISMTQGYNRALANDARYKIYLHQDTFITNSNLLHHLLDVFKSAPRLGLIGTIGCKKLPSSGIWWEGKPILGKAQLKYLGQSLTSVGREVETLFEEVESIDGYFMVTQYDLPWREEISGFHYYDASQCIEFIKNNYLVGVPRQTEFWCEHHVEHPIDHVGHQKLLGNFQSYYIDFLRGDEGRSEVL